jgi:hypothetical protein
MSNISFKNMSKGDKIRAGLLILALLLPLLPFVTDYMLHIVILIFLYMILALGLNIVPCSIWAMSVFMGSAPIHPVF